MSGGDVPCLLGFLPLGLVVICQEARGPLEIWTSKTDLGRLASRQGSEKGLRQLEDQKRRRDEPVLGR